MTSILGQPLTLPCGAVLNNRLAKAAMTEGLATPDGRPTEALERLYGIWSDGGAGVLISGNIIIDKDHLERPGNVVIDRVPDEDMAERLKKWATAATRNGNHFWAQISHGGRQTQKLVNPTPKSASDVKLALPGGQFGKPVPLSKDEIAELVNKWAIASKACKDAGFTGLQIHGAHGYLISQFLSPKVNLRKDEYGGSLENRARFLLEIIAAVREAVGPEFPITVKLNSADFQKGGFDFNDSLQVVEWLEAASVDLIEISGGTYEQPKLLGAEGIEDTAEQAVAPSTAAREAYFVDFANAMSQKVKVPLMVTGGFRTRQSMEQVLEEEASDVIGLGRPLCLVTDAPAKLMSGLETLPRYEDSLGLIPDWLDFLKGLQITKVIDGFAGVYWFYEQLWMLGHEGRVDEDFSVFKAFRIVDARNKSIMKERAKLSL
ncbi:NADH:flavin oxidoreductase/NADH oxidase family protein [Kordiimonas sp. SCSIO 12610]|uniref:NADH:flavin oxidoreductase/NADH oxidase family protein n=1 Tax=Kordiimonas sp. SCSIO 12610 TaxID=2829597 RepID=UPI002109A442|nr:NADH:flavin oxidoreductase/NADH oxidase family protein [Kordiimonas sp. SCSIO 12610]UTW54699.1 NADH:flavin oxidoreductase/NADH oxidase family protein [Kordiimonas sp. SCSIO 12610]